MKKIFKFFKYVLLTVLAVILISILYVFISNKIFIGGKDSEFTDYLKNNHISMNDKIGGQLFDDNFYNSQVILLGEIHGYADNQKLDLNLLKFLNQKSGVKYYIAEMDSTNSHKLNLFLHGNTKDQDLLKEVVLAVKKRIPQQSSKELMEKWNAVYDYNQTLKDSLKISVIGVDTDFNNNSRKISRDSAMIINFKNTVKKLNIEREKFYGFFGFYHVLQHGVKKDKKPFAEELKNSGFKTSSIVSYPLDSEMYLPKNPQFPTPENEKIGWINADGPFMLVKGMNDFKDFATPNSITLFKLNAKNSPYQHADKLISVKSRMFGESFAPQQNTHTLDYFQYAVITRNSKALTPIQ
ncbi:hypothetical protein BBH99_11385 [Chryseobacterium contaminans]|uniref:Erythromycin esterase n=1 Tax=Chryseobacterium contaminans TaxID=1423959 RepID=A0A1M7DBH0_9FLAO|nr:hypothetical protein [Chryseobacterium contaminans]OCA77665.1 hypothetical protein BBH99_11385 [Chryseobacterium contaminans]SHL76846.1 hypothetical protein SAMN05444407_10651 [Chryseobacterium contaminans]